LSFADKGLFKQLLQLHCEEGDNVDEGVGDADDDDDDDDGGGGGGDVDDDYDDDDGGVCVGVFVLVV
jgi:hypothetical protein